MKEERLIDALARRLRAALSGLYSTKRAKHFTQAQKLLDTATKDGYTHPNNFTISTTSTPCHMRLLMTHSDTEARVLRLENAKRHEFLVPLDAQSLDDVIDCGFQKADACTLEDLAKVLFHTKIPLE